MAPSTVTATLHRAAVLTVGLPRDQVLALFTPEGERRWVDGWDPQYPDPRRSEGPGAVFTTRHGGHETTWIIVDQRPDSIRYARIANGISAGTITVEVVGSEDAAAQVRVTHDLTALSAAGEIWLDAFAKRYANEIAAWGREIDAALRRP